jgi:hypothetical protein
MYISEAELLKNHHSHISLQSRFSGGKIGLISIINKNLQIQTFTAKHCDIRM